MVSLSVRKNVSLVTANIETSSRGKYQHRDVYQAPYIWVQFTNPKPHVLIDVVCRLFARNIHFNKIRAQASTRFQIYVNDASAGQVPGEDTKS